MPAVAAVMEHVQERTRKEKQERQVPEHVCAVFSQQEERRDREQNGEDDLRPGAAASAARSLLGRWLPSTVMFMIHELTFV